MHHIYHTDAFVLASRPVGEDSKTLVLFTRELGLLYARAQALRKISSKLRFTLQDFSRASVDLVRGKEIWRVTTAIPVDTQRDILRDTDKEQIVARIYALVVRMCSGEEPNPEVFTALENLSVLLTRSASPDASRSVELFTVARILISLGYLDRAALPESGEGIAEIPEHFSDPDYRKNILMRINAALAASQL